jgi:hypothetical protein
MLRLSFLLAAGVELQIRTNQAGKPAGLQKLDICPSGLLFGSLSVRLK